jgi:hypothetical protein
LNPGVYDSSLERFLPANGSIEWTTPEFSRPKIKCFILCHANDLTDSLKLEKTTTFEISPVKNALFSSLFRVKAVLLVILIIQLLFVSQRVAHRHPMMLLRFFLCFLKKPCSDFWPFISCSDKKIVFTWKYLCLI